jgi:hypothetical protein
MNDESNNNKVEPIQFTELEQELYDVLLDEYNDIFENIFNIKEKYIFDKILINSKAILGEKKNGDIFKVSNIKSSFKFKNIELYP